MARVGDFARISDMTTRLQHLEDIFPNLAPSGYSPKSEQSAAYNCVAYAAGDETRNWEGSASQDIIGRMERLREIHQ